MSTSPSPARRLTTSWKIEAANAVLIPALAVYVVLRSGGTLSTALVLSGLACSFLLVIGTIVLRMMLRKARGEATATADWLPLRIRMRWPAIGLCVAAAVANGAEWISGNAEHSAQFVAPAVLLLLAVLEYINYYHVQLQHFDHAPGDIGFFSTLIDHVHATYGTDACRTCMTGFSNGAMMTNCFVAVHADKVAAIAPVSGGWIAAYGGNESDLTPSAPVPVWIWRGSNETFVTGVGKDSRTRTEQDLAQRDYWVAHNAANLVATTSEVLNYGVPRIYVTGIYAGDAPVRFTEVQGTGHVYQPGAADLIWTRYFSQIVLSSGACAPCTADRDGSGTVDGADLGGLLSAWGACSSCSADLDGNGLVNGADLATLLGSWGACR